MFCLYERKIQVEMTKFMEKEMINPMYAFFSNLCLLAYEV